MLKNKEVKTQSIFLEKMQNYSHKPVQASPNEKIPILHNQNNFARVRRTNVAIVVVRQRCGRRVRIDKTRRKADHRFGETGNIGLEIRNI